jgi:CheY-like chemotaxis protein
MSALRKVLVVDDDPVVGKSFERVLAGKGYSVIVAHDAAQALERMREAEVDLLVTDIRMPGMDGLELAERVKERRPWTPVLIVTGYGTVADEERAKAAGVSAFLHKPLSPDMIEGSTEEALREAPQVAAVAVEAPAPEPAAAPARASRLKDIALFFAAPFIGLAYAIFMPIVGLGVLAWMAGKELGKRVRAGGAVATIAKMVALPFVGLAYVIVLPFAGIATLAWIAGRTLLRKESVE